MSEKTPLHDGNLGDPCHLRVSHSRFPRDTWNQQDTPEGCIALSGKYGLLIRLSPQQALELLAWLQQEQSEIQRIAKEQSE